MEYCYRCGVPENKALLSDIILPSGIKKVCRKCSYQENFPTINKPELKEPEKENVYQRIHNIAGGITKRPADEELVRQERRINEVVNRNVRRTVGTSDVRDKLIEHFHWIVMRIRRKRHISHKQMAEAIREPELAIRMLERGIVNDMNLVMKVEDFLSIRLRKTPEELIGAEPRTELKYPAPKIRDDAEIDFNKIKSLRIGDIKDLKEEKESEFFEEESDRELFEEFEEEDDWKAL